MQFSRWRRQLTFPRGRTRTPFPVVIMAERSEKASGNAAPRAVTAAVTAPAAVTAAVP